MGITEEHGHDTNIVFGSENFGSVHGAGILDDPWEPDSQRRYKALYFYVPPTIDEVGGLIVDDKGKIKAVGKNVIKGNIPAKAEKIDLKGKVLIPGIIDMKVFIGDPGFEYK